MSLKHRVAFLMVALASAALVAACDVEVGNFGASIGGDAPDYTITLYQGQDSIGGETVTLREVQDQGPLVVYYFDAECEECLYGMRVLQNFYAENQDGPTVLAVYVGRLTGKGGDEHARQLLSEAGATFPAGFTDDGFVIEEYELDLMPTTTFYKKNQHYRSRVSGGLLESDIRENVQEILD